MKLKIKNIILYPENEKFEPRFIFFETDKVNVITGYSQRGKSAIIPIIDYCLGSKSCNIPIGHIRNCVKIFAIYIEIDNDKIFIGRDSPKDSSTTSKIYFHSIKNKGENPSFNTNGWIANKDQYIVNREFLIKFLGNLAGFKNISHKENDTSISPFDAPSSFRDVSAFLYQPQNIIANPTTMFYKTDTFEHLKRLKILFPLALGYKSFEIILLEQEIERDNRTLLEKEKKLDDHRKQYENWQSDVYKYYSQAISLGLTKANINLETSKVEEILKELKKIEKRINNNEFYEPGAASRFAEKLNELELSRRQYLSQLDLLKNNLSSLLKFDDSKNKYLNNTVLEIKERLKPIDWFLEQKGSNNCPFCGSESSKAIKQLFSLKEEQEKNQTIIDQTTKSDFSFEKEKITLKLQIKSVEDRIKEIDDNIVILQNKHSRQAEGVKVVFRFAGRLNLLLKNMEKIKPSGELSMLIANLTTDLILKRKKLKKLKNQFDKSNALLKVSSKIKNYVNILPVEDKINKMVYLDPEYSANIKIEDIVSNNVNFLSRIGSGANHMCYHISTLLGLHEYFLGLQDEGKNNFIPSFLILDQPSQVYFPEGFSYESKKEAESNMVSEDIKNTSTIFYTCSKFMEKTSFQTQIIILEHAPKQTWKDCEHINLVEEWRGDIHKEETNYKALIPKEWLTN